MYIDNDTILLIIAGFIIVTAFIYVWIAMLRRDLHNERDHNARLEEDNMKWRVQYEDHVGKPIKDVLLKLKTLEVVDKRDHKNTIVKNINFAAYDLYWTEDPNFLRMKFTSTDGFEYALGFKKKQSDKE